MFLRSITRKKNGKEHHYWSIVENRRVARGRVVQRQVLYLGEINANQEKWLARALRFSRMERHSPERGACWRRRS
jgi:hypothetical protein